MEFASKVQHPPWQPRHPMSWDSKSSILLINISLRFTEVMERESSSAPRRRQVLDLIRLMRIVILFNFESIHVYEKGQI